jgi:16S rRNA (uracil1498-N3)-methyltransferase
MGVEKITFVRCERSQGNVKITDKVLEKFKTILLSSCEQCGRNTLMRIDIINFEEYIKNISEEKFEKNYENYICDFSGQYFLDKEILSFKKNIHNDLYSFLIGPEGGFSPNEKGQMNNLFQKKLVKIRKFNTSLVLKSESACSFSTDILLSMAISYSIGLLVDLLKRNTKLSNEEIVKKIVEINEDTKKIREKYRHTKG